MTFHDGPMTPEEIRGTLLRMATDKFESGVDTYAYDEQFALMLAEHLLHDVREANQKLLSETDNTQL